VYIRQMHRTTFALSVILLCGFGSLAQYPSNPIRPTAEKERLAGVEKRNELKANSSYLGIEATNIGPTIMSGRVVDMAIDPYDTKHFFVAYATGGCEQ
jgi:hypothetical protein